MRICFGKDVRPRFLPRNLRKLGEDYQFILQIVCYLFPWPSKTNKSLKVSQLSFPFVSKKLRNKNPWVCFFFALGFGFFRAKSLICCLPNPLIQQLRHAGDIDPSTGITHLAGIANAGAVSFRRFFSSPDWRKEMDLIPLFKKGRTKILKILFSNKPWEGKPFCQKGRRC